MRGRAIARNYAAALFELGREHGEEEAYTEAFGALEEVVAADARIRSFLETPRVGAAAKERVLREALEGRVPDRFLRFVLVVLAKRRQGLLGPMGEEYRALLDEHAGRVHAEVTLAREPDAATESLIGERLSGMLDRKVVPHIRVNPEIIGGLVVRWGDLAMDGSLRRQLVSLRREMLRATLPQASA